LTVGRSSILSEILAESGELAPPERINPTDQSDKIFTSDALPCRDIVNLEMLPLVLVAPCAISFVTPSGIIDQMQGSRGQYICIAFTSSSKVMTFPSTN
jgi:hypothetical protein